MKLIKFSENFAKKTGYENSMESIQNIKSTLNKKEIIIVVCGEIKRGKSSLLSAFLEDRDIFPIDVNVATNTVTVVRYGEVEKIEVIFEDNDKYGKKIIERSEIADYVTEQGNKKNTKRVQCLSIETPNEKLKEGLVLVDTPGVGSLNLAHSEVTYGYLPNADILLFVSDALSPLTEPELKFLKSATRYCQNIIYPLTKIDKTSNYKKILETNIENISKATSVPVSEVKMLAVSNLAKLKYLETNNKMMLKNSNFLKLESAIWKMVYEKRAEIIINPPLLELQQEMEAIRNNLKLKYISLTQDNDSLKDLEKELNDIIDEKQKLLEEGAEWKSELGLELTTINNTAIQSIRSYQLEMEGMINQIIETQSVSNLNEITMSVNGMLGTIALDIKDKIIDSVNDLTYKTEERLGLLIEVNSSTVDKIDVELGAVNVNIKEKKKTDKALIIGRNVAISGSGGGAITALVGGVVGGAIGLLLGGPAGAIALGQYGAYGGGLLGGALGSSKGFFDGIKQLDKLDKPHIKQAYMKHINLKLQEIINSVNMTIKELSFSLTKELNYKIRSLKSTLDNNIKEIQNNLKLTKSEALEQAKEMKPLFEQLNEINAHIDRLKKVTVKDRPNVSNNKVTSNDKADNEPVEKETANNQEQTAASRDEEGIDLGFMEE